MAEGSGSNGDKRATESYRNEEVTLLLDNGLGTHGGSREDEAADLVGYQPRKPSSSMLFRSVVHSLVRAYLDNYVPLILTTTVFMALNAACLKILTVHISVFQIVAGRSVVCAIIVAIICYSNGLSFTEPRSKMPFFILRGIVGATAFLCAAIATFELPLSESSFMNNSYPAVTAVLSWMFGMEHLGFFSWSGIFGCLAGNALVAHPPFLFGGHEDWGTSRAIGIVSAISGNFFLASTFIVMRYLGKEVNAFVLSTYMHLTTLVFCMPFLFVGFPMPMSTRHSSVELLCFSGICAAGVVAQITVNLALQVGPPSKVTSILLTNMLLSAAFGMLALSESMSIIAAIGAALILVSVLLVQLQKSTEKKNYQPVSTTEDKDEIELATRSEAT